MDIKSESDLPSFVVPARALGELSRLLNELGDQNLSMKINEQNTQVEFDLGHSRMIAQLLQGTFPNYEQLIPNEWKTQIRISSKEFIRETKIASIFARDGSGIIRLSANPSGESAGKLVIAAKADELGDNVGEIGASIDGEELNIAFNSRYLMDALQILENEDLIIEGSSSQSPGVIKSISDDNFLHVVMPMFVQW